VIDGARLISDGSIIDELTVVGVDLDAYRRAMARTQVRIPGWPKKAGPGVPALFSRAAAGTANAGDLSLSTDYGLRLPLRNAGTIPGFPTRPPDGKFVVVPYDALARATGGGRVPGSIFVRGDHLDVAELRRNAYVPSLGAAGASTVSTYRMAHDSITAGELGHLVGAAFGVAGFLVAGYGALAVLVLLFSGARERGRTVSYLRTLGLSRRQAHRLAFVEVTPVLFIAAAAGWVLGLGLPSIVGSAMDLRPYTGGFPVTRYVPDLPATALLAGGLLVFAGLAVYIDAAIGARRRLGGVLRIGDT
jgi:putative ABC transport system permease protein